MPKGGNGNGDKGRKPPKIVDQAFDTPEGPANGTLLGMVIADVKPSKSTWSILSGNDDGAFSIDPLTGELSVADGSAVDYEAEPTRDLVVQVLENGSKAHSATVTVNISDVNEAPSAGPDVVTSFAETVDQITVLASLSATDPDTLADDDSDPANDGFNNLTYAITGGDPDDLFEIDANGNISLAAGKMLDYETAQKHVLEVTVTDGGGLSDTAEVTVNVMDVNEVGDLDAFVTHENQLNQILMNDGTGTFTEAALQPPGTAGTLDAALGDLDGDGDLDVLVTNDGGKNVVTDDGGANQVLINDGTGTFTEAALQPPGTDVSKEVALGDLDGDGDLDAFIANLGANQVLMNDGTGTFTEAALQPPGTDESLDVELGDLDGDGDLDAFVANVKNTAANQVLMNDGTGTFTEAALQPPGTDGTRGVALGDLDGDGDLDAFVANYGANQVLINDGSGTFTAPDALQPPGSDLSFGVALGDLDGDGDLDAFVNNNGANQVLINDGSGTFTAPDALQPPGSANGRFVALGDLDWDGDLDAFVANVGYSSTNQVLMNDGTGTLTAPAALQPPGNDPSADVALGDLDGDGTLAAVDENGLPNIDPGGLLPTMYVDFII